MKKRLTTKLQKLQAELPEQSAGFAQSLALEPVEPELVIKKGRIYGAYQIDTDDPVDCQLIDSIVKDVLSETYYQSDNISTIQSLEKALIQVNDKVTKLSFESISARQTEIKFNFSGGVLWGSVFYFVKFGSGHGYFMRDTGIKEVTTTAEGNFAVASGVVSDGDVIILASTNFIQKFPTQRITSSPILQNEITFKEAAIVLKLIVDTTFTEEEIVNIQDTKNNSVPRIKLGQRIGLFFSKLKEKKQSKAGHEEIQSLAMPTQGIKLAKQNGIRINKVLSTKTLIPIVLIGLIASIAISPKLLNKPQEKREEQPASQTQENPQNNKSKLEEEQKAIDEKEKVTRVSSAPFYDIKIADENATPTTIEIVGQTIFVADSESGKLYKSDTSTAKFEVQSATFNKIANLSQGQDATELVITDDTGYKVLNPINLDVKASFSGKFSIIGTYLGNFYVLDENKITKYTLSGNSYTPTLWGQSNDFSDAKAMDVAYSIFVVTKKDELVAYTRGEKSNFAVKGLPTPFKNITDVVTNVDLKNIYVADAGNKRVVVLDGEGNFLKQYKSEGDVWHDIKGIAVSKDEKKLVVLNGSLIYTIEL